METSDTFVCDHCEKVHPLFDGDTLNGYHDAGIHLCPVCDQSLADGLAQAETKAEAAKEARG